jgi:uncharacterized membrane protein YfcA
VKELAEKTFSALMANMQIIESRRAIEEAESVTKLTELAFFFIPLTFTASVFGMQVKESDPRVHLSVFFALALPLTVFSYAVRLLVRSSHISSYKHAWETRVRDFNNIQRTSTIPNSAYAAWLYARFGPIIGFSCVVLGFIAASLSAVWTRELSRDLKVVGTVIITLGVFIGVWAALRFNEKFRKYLLEGSSSSWFRDRHSKKSNLGRAGTLQSKIA